MPAPEANSLTGNENLTFEKVWAMFQETDRKIQASDREFKESLRELKETVDKTSKQMKETDRRIGELGNRFGELAEHLVAPSIMEKFNERNFHFNVRSENVEIREAGNPVVYAEIDILLESGDIAIAIEVKAKPKQQDVDDHIERMEILRRVADRRQDRRKYQGAIAGAIMPRPVRDYALKKGFYVIEQTGDTVRLDIPEGFKPREW